MTRSVIRHRQPVAGDAMTMNGFLLHHALLRARTETAVGDALLFVRIIAAIVLSVAHQRTVDTMIVFAFKRTQRAISYIRAGHQMFVRIIAAVILSVAYGALQYAFVVTTPEIAKVT